MSDLKKRFQIPPFEYFDFKNIYTGSMRGFNYKIWPKEQLEIAVWYGKNCYEKSVPAANKEFTMDESGREELLVWLEEQYSIYEENAFL